jgi:hypothetical protein
VANVLSDTSKPLLSGDDSSSVLATFHNGSQEKCSTNWLRSMNGLQLLHSALALYYGMPEAQNIYWEDALMRVSRDLCHS